MITCLVGSSNDDVIIKNKTKKVKKVNFDLKKNKVYQIPKIIQTNEIQTNDQEENLIVKNMDKQYTKVENTPKKETVYSFNPQLDLINELENDTEEDLFASQSSYWEGQDIKDFTYRENENKMISDFNEVKNNSDKLVGQSISNVYDELTNGKNLISPLRHHDPNLFENMPDAVFGYSMDCNQMSLA
tara:strand:- start:566 stop:1126 length:561 start_codon:yes stop_codon:yes gene_type:complete